MPVLLGYHAQYPYDDQSIRAGDYAEVDDYRCAIDRLCTCIGIEEASQIPLALQLVALQNRSQTVHTFWTVHPLSFALSANKVVPGFSFPPTHAGLLNSESA